MLKEGFEPIPGYRLLNFLGRGQFGEVWRATSPGGTYIALKFLNVQERQGRKEFRAIQKVKGIRYPHLVQTYALWLLDENMHVIDDAAFDSSQPILVDSVRATVSAYDKRVNVAVTDCALDIVTVQGPVPEHTPPNQPAKLDVASGLAESVTTAPVG